jgi:hypothetical protein
MPRRSPEGSPAAEAVRLTTAELPPPSAEGLARLRAAMGAPVDTSDVPDAGGRRRVERGPGGRLPKPRESPIRAALLEELGRRGMTRYQLWRAARAHCPTLHQSAVYEYLRGRREIGLPYAEAMMQAAGLVVSRARRAASPSRRRRRPKAAAG